MTSRSAGESALRHNAAYVFIAHNHPNGTPEPSGNDLSATLKIRAALSSLDIILADHIITAHDGTALSLRESCPAEFFNDIQGYAFTHSGGFTTDV